MLRQERLQWIRNQLRADRVAQIHELADRLDVSESTIRRDVTDLEHRGLVKKVFGGAVSTEAPADTERGNLEPSVAARASVHVREKRLIAAYAASLINRDDFVYLDAGTTTGFMIDYLTCRDAVYVTNGLRHALRLSARGFEVYLLSGRSRAVTEAVTGAAAVESMRRYDFTKAFLGTNGIHLEKGLTTPDIEEGLVKSEAVRHAYITYITADSSKFGLSTAARFADLADVCVLTEHCPDAKYRDVTIIKEVKE
ncbi:MAG: DeoR/GlpR family DNA-binding transcription regulator [Anaerovoracaceae bacterium]|jgi:DeoR family fructose operon transcriptional repressor